VWRPENRPNVCGSIKRGILVQDTGSVLIRSAERYIELGQTLFGFVSRLGVKLVDGNAVSALKLA
jgi:HK97 family phage major capsid protein